MRVSGGPLNTVVISPLLFRLSVAFSSKSPGSLEGPVLLYAIGLGGEKMGRRGASRGQREPPPSLHTQNTHPKNQSEFKGLFNGV